MHRVDLASIPNRIELHILIFCVSPVWKTPTDRVWTRTSKAEYYESGPCVRRLTLRADQRPQQIGFRPMSSTQRFSRRTTITHAGRHPHDNHGVVNPPVYHASTILQPSLDAFEAARKPIGRDIVTVGPEPRPAAPLRKRLPRFMGQPVALRCLRVWRR